MPLFHAAWLFAVGIAISSAAWLQPGMMLIALAVCAAACVIAVLPAQRIQWAPMALLWLLLGAWCAEMQPRPAPAQPLLALSDGLLRTVEGTVESAGPIRSETDVSVDEPAADAAAQTIDLHLSSIEVVNDVEDVQEPITGSVRLTIRWPRSLVPQSIDCGDRIRAVARLLPPQQYRDPGAWSRTDYLLQQGITASATVDHARVERLKGSDPGR